MADDELAAIRAARLKELQQQSGQRNTVGGTGEDAASQRQQDDEARHTILSAILTPGARERLHRIELVKPDRARGVSDLLINMQRSGRIRNKITEEDLIGLLDQISAEETKKKETKIVYDRRRYAIDDDDDDALDL